jgi:LysM repeat protein
LTFLLSFATIQPAATEASLRGRAIEKSGDPLGGARARAAGGRPSLAGSAGQPGVGRLWSYPPTADADRSGGRWTHVHRHCQAYGHPPGDVHTCAGHSVGHTYAHRHADADHLLDQKRRHLARQFGVTVQAIQELNGIADPRRLQIGQEIMIPLKEGDGEPTVIPTPTPVALKVQGLAFYRTPVDSLWCLGEVVNLSGQPAEEIQVQISLHDEQGRLLASGAAFVQLDILAPAGRAPFAVLFAAPPASFAQYQTRVLSGVPSTHLGPRYPDLTLVEDHGRWLDQSNYQVQGQVRNTGHADAEQVAIVITLYDEQDHVVGARTVGIPADLFLAGATAPFEVTLTPLGPVARYDVQVQGWWIGYQIPTATGTAQATPGP